MGFDASYVNPTPGTPILQSYSGSAEYKVVNVEALESPVLSVASTTNGGTSTPDQSPEETPYAYLNFPYSVGSATGTTPYFVFTLTGDSDNTPYSDAIDAAASTAYIATRYG